MSGDMNNLNKRMGEMDKKMDNIKEEMNKNMGVKMEEIKELINVLQNKLNV
jgi:tetrahydromethanopterin S-methyltransferase subunit G